MRVQPRQGEAREHDRQRGACVRSVAAPTRGAARSRRRRRRRSAASSALPLGFHARRAAMSPYTTRKIAPAQRTTSMSHGTACSTSPMPETPRTISTASETRADRGDDEDVLAADALAQHEEVLRADRDDEREAEAESGEQGSEHTSTLGARR